VTVRYTSEWKRVPGNIPVRGARGAAGSEHESSSTSMRTAGDPPGVRPGTPSTTSTPPAAAGALAVNRDLHRRAHAPHLHRPRHILFLIGLLLLADRSAAHGVTGFTIGHSLTLAPRDDSES
jgi:hypothetical protein